MGFRDEVASGIVQEFQLYKRQKCKMFGIFMLSNFFLVTILLTTSLKRNEEKVYIFNSSMFLVLHSPIALIITSGMSANHDSKLENFMRVNGMSKLAYKAKSLFANYIIVLTTAFLFAFSKSRAMLSAGGSSISVLQIFVLYLFAAVAFVDLCYLTARFVAQRFVTYMSVLWFFVFPFIVDKAPELKIYFGILNPFVAVDVSREKFESEWFGAFAVMLGACIIYSGIFAITEWVTREEAEKRKLKRGSTKEKMKEISLPLMELGDDDEEDLIVNDIEASAMSSGVSSARYEEPIPVGNTNKTIIRVRELGKIYKNTTEPALDNVTLQIQEGEVFCLLGSNGAGKTTLLNILCGLTPKTEGSVHYANKLTESNGISQLIGYCSQENLAFTENTVHENFMLMAKIRGIKKEQAKPIISYLIQQFQLSQLEHMVVAKLRVEERKRLSLALALLNNPKIIIMDEPTSGLDVITRREMWQKIQVLKKSGKTVVFTTQFLDDAEALADRVAILARGGLFALGSIDYIKKTFGTGYTLVISNSVNPGQLASQASQITNIVTKILPQAELTSDTTLNILKYALSFSDRNKFSRLLRELEAVPDIQINLQRTSLEDAFKGLERNFKMRSRRQQEGLRNSGSLEEIFAKNYETGLVTQTKAIILRRFYTFKSEKKQVVFLMIFTLLGTALKVMLDKHPLGSAYFGNKVMNPTRPVFIYQILMFLFALLFSAQEMMMARIKDSIMVIRINGLRDSSYYLGNLIADFILLLPLAIAFGVECIFYEFSEDCLALNLARFIFTPLSIIPFAYLSSLLAYKNIYMLLMALIFLMTSYLAQFALAAPELKAFSGVGYENVSRGISILFLFAVGYFPGPLIKDYLHLVVISFLWHYFLLHYRENFIKNLHMYRAKLSSPPSPGPDVNHFITQEKARLSAEENKDMVKIIGGEKYISSKRKILSNLNFGVEKGQIFCLLGPNHAGKSLIFDVLNRRTFLDSGNIFINSKEVSEKYPSTATTGVCLQSDTHWDTLTVRENLKVVAVLRGMNDHEANEAVEKIMHALDLHRHSSKFARHLSAGTQRKLNVAIALIGGPELITLDTPTTGVDPVGRNQIWTLLKKLVKVKNSTILLSTQYTEDAELVADKLGIMVNGSLATIGTISALRKSYTEYEIVIDEVAEGFTEMLIDIVKGIVPEAEVMSHSNKKGMRFKVPSTTMKFGQIVQELENLSTDQKITDFSVNVKTLEQAFMEYASQQVKPDLVSNAAHQSTLYGKSLGGE